jgi:hypothetical protein
LICGALVAGCSGGGNKSSGAANPSGSGSQVATQSAGGIWRGFPAANENLSLYIAETGELIVQGSSFATTPPVLTFGTGALIVNNPNDVAGTYRSRSLPPTIPSAGQTCEIDGTVTERSLLEVTIRCTDTAGNMTERNVTLLYDPAYDADSSLAEIAGNYTVPFRPLTNILNINASGVVFGMLDNGPNCTVNGQVQIIDARFNLYRFELQLSLCQGVFNQPYDGTTLRGFAARNLPGMRPGAFILLLAGTPAIGTAPVPLPDFFSLLYEPV